jgi:hypothetical protein
MEGVFLIALGRGGRPCTTHPYMELSDLDNRTNYLLANSIEKLTAKGYTTGV